MALNLQQDIQQSKDCSSFYWFDTTPLWNSTSATGGYDPYNQSGGSSLDPNDIVVTSCTLDITLPDLSVVTVTLAADDYDLTRLEDTGTGLMQRTLTATDLGTITDGVYKFVYTVVTTNASVTYTASCYIVNDCEICCSLDTKLKALSLCTDCKDNKDIKNLYDAYLKRDAARMLASCNDYTGAQEVLDYLTNYINAKRCDSC